MFPIGDDNSDLVITPYVNYAFIAVNVLVFVFLQGFGGNDWFNAAFSLVPKEITGLVDLAGNYPILSGGREVAQVTHVDTPLPVYFNFLSSMFMHADVMHLGGNMLFLWIFGDNIENLIGHFRFIVFYLVCGVAAAIAQVVLGPDSIIPMLGASGAISGVLGGYVLLFPTRKVRVILLRMYTTVPAWIALGMWIALQIFNGYMSYGSTGGGVAFGAHIGGFIAGLALIKLFAIGKSPRFFAKA
jgi:membrane associated rhomboid family serine protease